MLVQFRTDKEVVSEGFHATFVFEKNNGSIVVTHPKDPEDKDPVDLDNGLYLQTFLNISKIFCSHFIWYHSGIFRSL